MIHAAKKLVQAQQGVSISLRKAFSRLGKHEKMVKKNPHVLDYTRNPIIKVNIEEARNQFKRDNTVDGIKLLSEAASKTKKEVKLGKELRIDSKRINKEIKKFTNQSIDKSKEVSYQYLVDNDYLQQNLSKIEENKRLIKELKEFKKLYFEKKEIKRLLRMQERKIENYLPHSSIGVEDIESAQRYHAYKESSNTIKNQRIQNMLEGGSKENKKLSLLISSGLLDTSKNIQQIIASSTELLLQDMKKNPSQFNKNEESVYQDVVLDEQNNQEININDEGEQQNDDITFADNMIVNGNQDSANSMQSMASQTDKQKMMEIYGDKISQMGFDITVDELSFVNFDSLAMFFDEFVNSTPEEKLKTLSKIQMLDNLRSYENYLFDKHRNNDISLRVKGKLEFKDLTEKENLNYIKYNIKKPSELFLMIQNIPQQQLSPSIVSQGVSKIASFKFESKENYLAVISNYNYRALLRNCVNTCNQMNDTEFVDMIWSIGKIHKDEHGIVYEKLFNKLMSVTSQQLKVRVLALIFFNQEMFKSIINVITGGQTNKVLPTIKKIIIYSIFNNNLLSQIHQ